MTASELISTITALYPGNNWQAVIFSFYCGDWEFNRNFLSPLRTDDTNPSMRIFQINDGNLLAHDYGENITYSLWTFVYKYHVNNKGYFQPFNHQNIIELINSDMKLGLDNEDIFSNPQIISNLSDISRDFKQSQKLDLEIAVFPKEWNDVDFWYWKIRGISLECCNFFEIGASAKTLFNTNNTEWYEYHRYKRHDPLYYYHFTNSLGKSKFKLLRPFAPDKADKWRTNIDKQDMSLIQGWKQAPETYDVLFLTSSLADIAAIRMCGFPAMALHGEGYIPTEEFITGLKLRFKYIFLLYDNDRVGREKSKLLLDKFQLDGELFVPERPLNNGKMTKDPTDLNIYNEGNIDELKTLLTNYIVCHTQIKET